MKHLGLHVVEYKRTQTHHKLVDGRMRFIFHKKLTKITYFSAK